MFNPFSALGDLNKLRTQAAAMQQALANETITVTHSNVTITIRGDQQVTDVKIDDKSVPTVVTAMNKAVRQVQELAAKKLLAMKE